MKKTISIDFDGTIHTYNGWNNGAFKEPIAGAKEAILKLQEAGFNVIISTTRDPVGVRIWLDNWHFPKLEVTNEKPLCTVHVDDRVICFNGKWTPQLIDRIASFQTYWERAKEPTIGEALFFFRDIVFRATAEEGAQLLELSCGHQVIQVIPVPDTTTMIQCAQCVNDVVDEHRRAVKA